MTDFTQAQLDELLQDARMLVPNDKTDAFEADVKSKTNFPNILGRFLERFIDTMERRELAKYDAAPVINQGSNGGVRKPDATNPWSAAGWNVTAQGGIAKRLGDAKAAAMAKSAGCELGATRPNPAYN